LCVLPDADHSFHVPARSTFTAAQTNEQLLSALSEWTGTVTRA
jgi:hypothetical protein